MRECSRRHLCTAAAGAADSSAASAVIAECGYRRRSPILQRPQRGSLDQALEDLDREGGVQNQSTYAALIRLCGDARRQDLSARLHRHLQRHGYDRGTYIGNLLVEMFGKCGAVEASRQAFLRIHQPNVFSGNILMAAYNSNSQIHQARLFFDRMPQRDTVSWNAMIAAYAQLGQWLPAEGLFEKMPLWDGWSWNACLRSYNIAGCSMRSKMMFDLMPQRTVISWNLTVSAYAQNGYLDQAMSLFERIPMRDAPLWNVLLNALVDLGKVDEALSFFESVPQHDTLSWNAKMKAYLHAGDLDNAKRVFDGIPEPDLASYTTLITAYFQRGKVAEARVVFDKMSVRDTYAWTAMVSGYAQNKYLDEARSLFDSMPKKNLVSWNAMIAGYGQNGNGKEAVRLFKLLDIEGMHPDALSFISALDACASQTSLADGRMIHFTATEIGFEREIPVGNSLVNMYGRCGSLSEAEAFFEKMVEKNVISWTTMAAAYAQCSRTEDSFHVVKRMALEGVMPNEVTFTVVLSVCSQAGKLTSAWKNFMLMCGDFDVQPRVDHFCCMVDLLGRAGHLKLAEELIENMPYEMDTLSLRTLLSACRSHEETKLGTRVAENALKLDSSQDASPYVLLSNAYAEAQEH